jgi:hypothetical protein
MHSPIVQDAPAYAPEQIDSFKADVYQDSYKHIPAVLTPQKVTALKQGIDRVFTEVRWSDTVRCDRRRLALRDRRDV